MLIDQWHQPLEMLGVTMRVQSCPMRPFFYKYEVIRIFLVDKKIIGYAQRFFLGLSYKFSIQRHDILDIFRFDEILGNYFEHGFCVQSSARRIYCTG